MLEMGVRAAVIGNHSREIGKLEKDGDKRISLARNLKRVTVTYIYGSVSFIWPWECTHEGLGLKVELTC